MYRKGLIDLEYRGTNILRASGPIEIYLYLVFFIVLYKGPRKTFSTGARYCMWGPYMY